MRIWVGVGVEDSRFGARVERRGSRVYDSGFHANQNRKYVFGEIELVNGIVALTKFS
jgi:hypothetical protein